MYRIERWGIRGVTFETAETKREANTIAEAMRRSTDCQQTVVIRPNGLVKICRNVRFRATK